MKTLSRLIAACFLSLSLSVAASELVNLNSADADALTTLDGVGTAKAEAIIAYRTEHGPFESVDQLTEVQGFGPKTLEQNRDRLTVGSDQNP